MDILEWKKYPCMQKKQYHTFKFIHFIRTIFLIPQRRDFNLKMRKLQTSIKSIILRLGIKQNLF